MRSSSAWCSRWARTSSAWPATVGVWLVGAPFTLELASRVAMANSIVVGASVALLAASALSLDKQIGKLWHRAH